MAGSSAAAMADGVTRADGSSASATTTASVSASSSTLSPSSRSKLDAAILDDASQSSLNHQLQALLDSFPALAHHSIHHTLPLGITTLTTLYTHFSSLPPPPTRPVISPLGASPPPPSLLALLEALKEQINGLLLAIDPIRTWIALNIPRMQDQKGITVTTKEDIVDMLSQARSSAQAVLDGITRYYSTRGKLVTKCIKFPTVDDYINAVGELDRKQWRVSLTMLVDLRGNHAVIYDTCTKNEDKLQHVDLSTSFEHMY